MESTMRYVLLVLGCLVILGILIDGLRRNRLREGRQAKALMGRLREDMMGTTSQKTAILSSIGYIEPLREEILSIRIMAPKNKKFGGYTLLQTILTNDFHYGEMQIFHRYADKQSKKPLFSLVSIEEPGDFNLTEIGKFSCRGLVLFMDAAAHDNPLQAFDDMVTIARLLADDLQAELEFDNENPLTVENVEDLRQKLGAK